MHVFVSRIYSSDVCLLACFLRNDHKRLKKNQPTSMEMFTNLIDCSVFNKVKIIIKMRLDKNCHFEMQSKSVMLFWEGEVTVSCNCKLLIVSHIGRIK